MILNDLNTKRKNLGMSYAALAKRSGVSMPTVVRILSGYSKASFENVQAVAEALGVATLVPMMDEATLCEAQARKKAQELVSLVQGTSALEGEGLDEKTLSKMIERTAHRLEEQKRKLWDE